MPLTLMEDCRIEVLRILKTWRVIHISRLYEQLGLKGYAKWRIAFVLKVLDRERQIRIEDRRVCLRNQGGQN